MTYLTDEEKKMPDNMRRLQLVLGIRTCKTKGEVSELLKEYGDLRVEETENEIGRQLIPAFKELLEEIYELFVMMDNLPKDKLEDFAKMILELKEVAQKLENGK